MKLSRQKAEAMPNRDNEIVRNIGLANQHPNKEAGAEA